MQLEKAMIGRTSNNDSTFDVLKMIAAIGYLVEQTKATMYPIMKMLYLADKVHLERHGRFIAGEEYVAMEQGPVPSHAYDMMKHLRSEKRSDVFVVSEDFFAYQAGHVLVLKQQPDLDELSVSDQQCLDEVVQIYRSVGHWGVRDLSHDEAWEKIWSRRNFAKSVPMPAKKIAEDLACGQTLIDHLTDPAPGEAENIH